MSIIMGIAPTEMADLISKPLLGVMILNIVDTYY